MPGLNEYYTPYNAQNFPQPYPRDPNQYMTPAQPQSRPPVGSLLQNMLSGGSGATTAANMTAGVPEAGGTMANIGQLASGPGQMANILEGSGATAPTPGMLEGMGAVLPWAGVAGIGAYTGYKAYDAWNKAKNKGAMGGLKQGIKSAGLLNAVPLLGQAAWGAGLVRGLTGGKKHKDQYARDAWRSPLKGNLIDDNYNVTLADGNKFNIGADGHKQYNVDMSRAGADQAIADVNPLAHLLSRGDGKIRSDGAGYLANAALSSGNSRANALKEYADAGFNHEKAYGAIAGDKGLDQHTRDSYLNGLDELFGVGAYSNGRIPRAPQPQQSNNLPPALQPRTSQPMNASPKAPSNMMIPRANQGRPAQPWRVN